MDMASVTAAIAAVCPIDGIAGPVAPPSPWTIYPAGDGSQWRIDFSTSATDAQRQAGISALAAYVDTTPVPLVTGRQIVGQARIAGISAALATAKTPTTSTSKPDDLLYVGAIGLDTAIPTNNPKVARVLSAAGVKDVPAFMAAALQLQS